jgi:hypothetical protein
MNKVNKNQQNSTVSGIEGINTETGLTPLQEKAALLLVSGKNITEVSIELSIDRGTLYKWFDKIPFKAYYNKQCKEVKDSIENGLMGLYNDSIQAIKEGIKSNNEMIKLKTAFWLIEKLTSQTIGETDPREMIKKQCTHNNFIVDMETLNKDKYQQMCMENNLIP